MSPITSPFDGLQMSRAQVCEFFAIFSRFEYSLKAIGYIRNQRGFAAPAWRHFAKEASGWVVIPSGSSIEGAVEFIIAEPPLVQLVDHSWKAAPLEGKTKTEKAINATCYVRNNLFHGGKHTRHSPAGRDERLVESSIIILMTCLEQHNDLRSVFETLPQ